jgi:cytoskeleton protein RodZ
MRVGSELKAARQKAGISVEVISKRTKLKVSNLVALENGDFKNLPTGLYLFSMVRAYAREVHIDPEPIVERLRAEFAEKDALDVTSSANARRSTEERSNIFRNATVATGVVLIAAAGAGAYFYGMSGAVREVRSTNEIRSSQLSSPAPATTTATAVDVARPAGSAIHTATSTKTHSPEPRTAAVTQAPQETVATIGAVSDALGSTEEPADKPLDVDELRPEVPVIAAAP